MDSSPVSEQDLRDLLDKITILDRSVRGLLLSCLVARDKLIKEDTDRKVVLSHEVHATINNQLIDLITCFPKTKSTDHQTPVISVASSLKLRKGTKALHDFGESIDEALSLNINLRKEMYDHINYHGTSVEIYDGFFAEFCKLLHTHRQDLPNGGILLNSTTYQRMYDRYFEEIIEPSEAST